MLQQLELPNGLAPLFVLQQLARLELEQWHVHELVVLAEQHLASFELLNAGALQNLRLLFLLRLSLPVPA